MFVGDEGWVCHNSIIVRITNSYYKLSLKQKTNNNNKNDIQRIGNILVTTGFFVSFYVQDIN